MEDIWRHPLEVLGEAGTAVPLPVDLNLWQEVALAVLVGIKDVYGFSF